MRFLKVIGTILLIAVVIFAVYGFLILPVFFPQKIKIAHMIDPDSYLVLDRGKIKRVQLIGVDAPEYTAASFQCYAETAKKMAVRDFFQKGTIEVVLEKDSQAGELDVHGRILAAIKLPDGRILNEELLRAGLAREYHPEGTTHSRQSDFEKAQQEAQSADRGLWATDGCNGRF